MEVLKTVNDINKEKQISKSRLIFHPSMVRFFVDFYMIIIHLIYKQILLTN